MLLIPSLALLTIGLIGSPFLLGVINRTKAISAGRKGKPLLQVYFDLIKLLRKDVVYSRTTTWIFRAGPIISLAGLVTGMLLMPHGGSPAILAFSGDFVLLFYLLGIGRFFIILAALDVGSSFEGMGASREALYSALTEPILFAVLVTLVRMTGELSLSAMIIKMSPDFWAGSAAALILLIVILFILLLTENSRIPIDDPNTHLELTMIHEVMVLDHSGPDFGLILYGSALKMWIFSALLTGLVIPLRSGIFWIDLPAFLAGMFLIAIGVGIVESTMARLRLLLVPRMLVGATAIVAVCIFLTLK